MSIIKIGEAGKGIYIDAKFDVNAAPFTVLKAHFKSPDGATTFERNLTAPAVDSPAILEEAGVYKDKYVTLLANTYGLYMTAAGDFAIAGAWCVYIEYRDATGAIFYGDSGSLTIGAVC